MKIKKTVTALCTLTAALRCGCGSAPASLPLDSPDISGNLDDFLKSTGNHCYPGRYRTDRPDDYRERRNRGLHSRNVRSGKAGKWTQSLKVQKKPVLFKFAQEETRKPGAVGKRRPHADYMRNNSL